MGIYIEAEDYNSDRDFIKNSKTVEDLSNNSKLITDQASKDLSCFQSSCGRKNKKRRIDTNKDSDGVSDYKPPAKLRAAYGLFVIDPEICDDSSDANNQLTTFQVSNDGFPTIDSSNFNMISPNNLEKRNHFHETDEINLQTGAPKEPIKAIPDLKDEQEFMETDDAITDLEETNEKAESEEEKDTNDQIILTQEEKNESEQLRFLLSNFTKEQWDRYEQYRSSAFPRTKIKKVIETIAKGSVSKNVVTSMAGIAKSFVGDIIERSLDVQEKQGAQGPLHPRHIRDAVRQLRSENKIPRLRDNFSNTK